MQTGYLRGEVIAHQGETFTLRLENGAEVPCVFDSQSAYAEGFNSKLKMPYACHCDGEAKRDSEGHLYFLVTKCVSMKTALAWDRMEQVWREKEERKAARLASQRRMEHNML